jgi:predicted phosphohydrolase
MDIFGYNWQNYMERLKDNWQNTVKKNDTVVINGDISWATYISDCFKDFSYLNSLNGNKIILKGNHDYWWESLTKLKNYVKENDFSILTRKSIRTSLESEINTIGNEFFITQTLETPNGKKVSISNNQKIYIPYPTEIEEIAKKYNYSKVEFFEDFENTPFTENSNELICILHA